LGNNGDKDVDEKRKNLSHSFLSPGMAGRSTYLTSIHSITNPQAGDRLHIDVPVLPSACLGRVWGRLLQTDGLGWAGSHKPHAHAVTG